MQFFRRPLMKHDTFNVFEHFETEEEAVRYLYDCLTRDSLKKKKESPTAAIAYSQAEEKYGKFKAFVLLMKAMSFPIQPKEASI